MAWAMILSPLPSHAQRCFGVPVTGTAVGVAGTLSSYEGGETVASAGIIASYRGRYLGRMGMEWGRPALDNAYPLTLDVARVIRLGRLDVCPTVGAGILSADYRLRFDMDHGTVDESFARGGLALAVPLLDGRHAGVTAYAGFGAAWGRREVRGRDIRITGGTIENPEITIVALHSIEYETLLDAELGTTLRIGRFFLGAGWATYRSFDDRTALTLSAGATFGGGR